MSDTQTVEFLSQAASTLARMTRPHSNTSPPRLVWLERVAAQAVTPQQIREALQALPEPVCGWWQTADHLCVATPQVHSPSPDSAEWQQLLEGEWTAGPQTIQVKRVGNLLRLARLVEHAQTHPAGKPMLATDHAQVPRQDIAQSMVVTTYAQWSEAQAQVVPVAQRLQQLKTIAPQTSTAQEAA